MSDTPKLICDFPFIKKNVNVAASKFFESEVLLPATSGEILTSNKERW